MTIRQSTGLRNHLQQNGSFRSAFQGGKLSIYSGAQVATADTAPAGTLLVTITDNSGAHTAEVRATGIVTLNTGASGSVDTVKVGGLEVLGVAVPFNVSLTQTATDVAAQINKFHGHKLVTATSAGAVITLTAKLGYGTAINGVTVISTVTTITKTDVNMGSAVAGVSQVNGLNFDDVAVGLLAKRTGQTWSGVGLVDGVAGWFRLRGPIADNDSADSAGAFTRLDGNIATSGGDMTASSTTLAAAATHTVSTFSPTEPANA